VLRRKQPIVFKDELQSEPLPQREDEIEAEQPSPRLRRDARQRLDALKRELDDDPITPEPSPSHKADRQSMEGLRAQYHWVLVNKGENGSSDSEPWRPAFKLDFTSPVFRIALVVVALAAGGMAAFLVLQRGQEPTAPTAVVETAADAPTPAPSTTKVLVATADIGMGQTLSPAAMSWQDWPEKAIRAEYITDKATPEAMTDMAGSMARFEIFSGEPISKAKLVSPGENYLSAVLDKGMRGVPVTVAPDTASGGFVFPNDRVDVVLTRTAETGQQRSETVLRNVRVLAIDARLGETGTTGALPDPADPKGSLITGQALAVLELDSAGAEVVLNATAMGRLSLVIRSMADTSTADANATSTLNQTIRMTSPFWR
jgi:pilus assembly protein CpaB